MLFTLVISVICPCHKHYKAKDSSIRKIAQIGLISGSRRHKAHQALMVLLIGAHTGIPLVLAHREIERVAFPPEFFQRAGFFCDYL